MKRILALLLSVCLLLGLCACGNPPAPEEPTSEPVSEPVSETPTEKSVFSLKTLPEIGAFTPDDKTAYFFDDGAHEDFEVRGDYGPILPYVAEIEPFREAPYFTYYDEDDREHQEKVEHRILTYEGRYGVMTRDGRIITGPLFDYCSLITDVHGKIILEFGIVDPKDSMAYSTVLIGGDGSWRLDFDPMQYVQFEPDGMEGCFSVSSYSENEAPPDYYTFDGERMTVPETVLAALRNAYGDAWLRYADDEQYLFRTDGTQGGDFDENDEYIEETTLYVRTDLQGNVLAELWLPLDVLEVHEHFLLCYDGYGDTWQAFSFDGQPLTERHNGYCNFDMQQQILIGSDMETGEVHAFDAQCNELGVYEMDWSLFEGGDDGSVFLDRTKHEAYAIADGSPIDLGHTNIRALDTVRTTIGYENKGLYLIVETDDGKCYLHNVDGSLIAAIRTPDYNTYTDENDVEERTYFVNITDRFILTQSEAEGWYYQDRQTGEERQLPMPAVNLAWEDETDEDAYTLYTPYDRYLVITYAFHSDEQGERTREELYDIETGKLLTPSLVWFEYLNGPALVTAKNESYVLDENGAVILRIHNNNVI